MIFWNKLRRFTTRKNQQGKNKIICMFKVSQLINLRYKNNKSYGAKYIKEQDKVDSLTST